MPGGQPQPWQQPAQAAVRPPQPRAQVPMQQGRGFQQGAQGQQPQAQAALPQRAPAPQPAQTPGPVPQAPGGPDYMAQKTAYYEQNPRPQPGAVRPVEPLTKQPAPPPLQDGMGQQTGTAVEPRQAKRKPLQY